MDKGKSSSGTKVNMAFNSNRRKALGRPNVSKTKITNGQRSSRISITPNAKPFKTQLAKDASFSKLSEKSHLDESESEGTTDNEAEDECVTADPLLVEKKYAFRTSNKTHSAPIPVKNPCCSFMKGYHIPLGKAAFYVLKFFISMDILDILIPLEICLVKFGLHKEYNSDFKNTPNSFLGIKVFHLGLGVYLTFMIVTFASLVSDCFYYKYGLEKFQKSAISAWLIIRITSMTWNFLIGILCLSLLVHYGGGAATFIFFFTLLLIRTAILGYCFSVSYSFYKAFVSGAMDPTLIWVREYESPTNSSVSSEKSPLSQVSSDNMEHIEGEVGKVMKKQEIPLEERYVTFSSVASNHEIFDF